MRDLTVSSDSLLSEWDEVEPPPLSGFSEDPCKYFNPLILDYREISNNCQIFLSIFLFL